MNQQVYFSDVFGVSTKQLNTFGAFDISLVNDLPLFIDPFLLFNSSKPEYRELHNGILRYMRFLRDKAVDPHLDEGLLGAWYTFPEVKQTWLGFSLAGNRGLGLRKDFASALHRNLNTVFADFGRERITQSSHLEKLCLIKEGIGRDRISDFTCNLIKGYLLQYTEQFAVRYIRPEHVDRFAVDKVRFNYDTESWESGTYVLPRLADDYVLLTPKDILTRDDTWINRQDLFSRIRDVASAVPDEQLRAQLNNYLARVLPEDKHLPAKERSAALDALISEMPAVLDHYISYKEKTGDQAVSVSKQKVAEAEAQFNQLVKELRLLLFNETDFYNRVANTYQDSLARVHFLKDVIENKDGYRVFYIQNDPIERESDIQIMYRLTWFASAFDVNREVNNGRGPVDFKVSHGSKDSTLVEFKLAKNTQLRRNLEKQVAIYAKASDTEQSIVVIIYFSEKERARVQRILDELGLTESSNIILIDACRDNKPSASKA